VEYFNGFERRRESSESSVSRVTARPPPAPTPCPPRPGSREDRDFAQTYTMRALNNSALIRAKLKKTHANVRAMFEIFRSGIRDVPIQDSWHRDNLWNIARRMRRYEKFVDVKPSVSAITFAPASSAVRSVLFFSSQFLWRSFSVLPVTSGSRADGLALRYRPDGNVCAPRARAEERPSSNWREGVREMRKARRRQTRRR